MLTSKQIRQDFIEFFEKQQHTYVPSSRVFPEDDPTLLFINAGMNQFKDVFLGISKRDYVRAANSQKCIRVSGKHNDLEEVGKDTYHHTFFEMLGNWSFGDYFKSEAITWAWQLFTEIWKIDENKLWASVFGGDAADGVSPDTEAEKLWVENTSIPKERVLRFGRKDNFWEMGDVGPCGPCSEIHIDLGEDRCNMKDDPNHVCQVNGDCERFMELWNLVFIQYNRDDTGKLHELPNKHVDTGAGLERIVAVLQNKSSNYDTDLFIPIIEHLEKLSGKKYTSKLGNDTDNAFRVIADHVRTLSFSIADGATPSSDGRGYVLRRILRRATRYGLILDLHEPFMYQLVPTLLDIMGNSYPELNERKEHVMNVIKAEETSFAKTLERGIEIFDSFITSMKNENQTVLSGDKAFQLYDTYGFPLDLTQLMAEERDLTVDVKGFEKCMDQQKAQSQAGSKKATYQADGLGDKLPATDDSHKYENLKLETTLIGYVSNQDYINEGTIPANTNIGILLDKTCAYAESGGQVGDTGQIESNGEIFNITDTQKVGDAIVHYGNTTSSQFKIGDSVQININNSSRNDTARNHTATHLLQWALQKVLGPHVKQQGSLVNPEYLRFDFTYTKPMTPQEITDVETLVTEKIIDNQSVGYKVLPIDQANQLGAMSLFSEKYGDEVRVVAIGTNGESIEDAFSREFCGGTHVKNTSEISGFKITREESNATGVRRITAMTGQGLNQLLTQRSQIVDQLTNALNATPEELEIRVHKLIEENKKLKSQLKKGTGTDLKSASQKLLDDAQTFGDSKVIVGEFPTAPVDMIRTQIDWLRQKSQSMAAAFASKTDDGKVLLFTAVTDDLIKSKGLKAGDIVKEIAPIVGGGGGGKPQLAQAGGKIPEKIEEALNQAQKHIEAKLN